MQLIFKFNGYISELKYENIEVMGVNTEVMKNKKAAVTREIFEEFLGYKLLPCD